MKPVEHYQLSVINYPVSLTFPTLIQLCFCLFLGLLLLSHASATNPGPIGWFAHPKLLAQSGWQIGPLAVLPIMVFCGWIYSWQITKAHTEQAWSWGRKEVTLPIFALTLLTFVHIFMDASIVLLNYILLFWFVYLFIINPPPITSSPLHSKTKNQISPLPYLLLIVLLGQSVVAILQVWGQRPLNLSWLGEPAMDLSTIGTSVVLYDGVNWLRAYGLSSHPNQLGLLLVTLILLLFPQRKRFNRLYPLLWLTFGLGLIALTFSWSRAAWLALFVGTAVYVTAWLRSKTTWRALSRRQGVGLFILTVLLFTLLFTYRDIVVNRFFRLDTPLESHSLYERKRDTRIALEIIQEYPLAGVGLGNYQDIATTIDPHAQIVHNVPLLITAEFGVLGTVCWFVFLCAPLFRQGTFSAYLPQTAVWLALITISFWQPEPHLFLPKGAIIWALAAAAWSQKPASKPTMRLTYA